MPLRNDNSNKRLIPNNDLEEGEFHNTYLYEVPKSRDYNDVNYQDLKNTMISNTNLLDLFSLFQSQAIPGIVTFEETDQHEELHNWYMQLNRMISNQYFPTLEKLYRYNESVQLLHGYKNTKEYLIRALVRNKFLLLKFLEMMNKGAMKLGIGMNEREIIRLMKLEHPLDEDKYTIIQFLNSVMEISQNQKLYNEMVEYVEVTSDLSNRIEKILEKHSQQIIESLRGMDN